MNDILIISLITYLLMIIMTKYRLPISMMGLAIMLIYGSVSNTIPVNMVFQSFPVEIIVLIIVLALFTKKFENLGFFKYASNILMKIPKKNRMMTILLLIFIIYASSLFMNNLSVILLFTFICIEISIQLDLPIVPVLASTIIASNIGGAALPWADTPAVIITLYTNFTLIDFLTMLFLPCFVYVLLLVFYTKIYSKKAFKDNTGDVIHLMFLSRNAHHHPAPPHHICPPILPLPHHERHIKPQPEHDSSTIDSSCAKDSYLTTKYIKASPKKTKQIIVTSGLFILLIVGVGIAPFMHLSIAFIAMLCASLLLFFDRESPEDFINTLPILDSLIFIATLFFIGTVLEKSGILSMAVDNIILFAGTNEYLIILVIIISAFIIATLLSAGPAAATLLPICLQLTSLVNYRIIYTALALGILAGSSMFPWSATGGPIMLGEANRYINQANISDATKKKVRKIFNLKQYLLFSIPFSLFILCCSIIYLLVYIALH